jgi:ketosteroid isomerase-like protein
VTPAPATPAADPLDEARAAVTGWARAWSDRDVGAYLSFYGTGFVPERGASRAAWEKTRRQMIERRRSISVAINELQLEPLSADRVIANYKQDYAADTYREAGTPKHLVLAREGGAWRIVAEAAGKAGAAAP